MTLIPIKYKIAFYGLSYHEKWNAIDPKKENKYQFEIKKELISGTNEDKQTNQIKSITIYGTNVNEIRHLND